MMTPRLCRRGLTLLQLLIVLALFAVLLGLGLAAYQSLRLVNENTRAQNNIKQILLATINYADTYGILPPGVDDNHFSASAYILPFVEQQELWRTIDFKKSIDDEANAKARKAVIATYLSPNDPTRQVKADWGATNYLFNDQVFFLNSKSRFPASITDGTSNTIFVGETLKGDGGKKADTVQRQYVLLDKKALDGIKPDTGVEYFKDGKNIAGDRCASWMDGRFLMGTFNGQLQPNDMRPDVSCAGAGGVSALRSLTKTVNVGMGDGSARAVSVKISKETWQAAITPAAGDLLGSDW